MSEVKVIKQVASNFKYKETCKTPYEQVKDNQTCAYCANTRPKNTHACLNCTFTCTCSDGEVFTDSHAKLSADVHCIEKNGKFDVRSVKRENSPYDLLRYDQLYNPPFYKK